MRKIIIIIIIFISTNSFGQAKEKNQVDFLELRELKTPCYYYTNGSKLTTKNSELNLLGYSKEKTKECKKAKFPKIDLKNYHLVSFKGITKGCSTPNITAKAHLEDETIILKLIISKQGDCKNDQDAVYLGLIPNEDLPKDVSLEVEEFHQ